MTQTISKEKFQSRFENDKRQETIAKNAFFGKFKNGVACIGIDCVIRFIRASFVK